MRALRGRGAGVRARGGCLGSSRGAGRCEVVVADADPVVETLEGEVQILRGFEFEDGEAAVAGDGEEVEHAAVACLEGGDLGVDVGGVELAEGALAFGEGADVLAEGGFEPGFG